MLETGSTSIPSFPANAFSAVVVIIMIDIAAEASNIVVIDVIAKLRLLTFSLSILLLCDFHFFLIQVQRKRAST